MLPLPGPRAGWWLLGICAVALPLAQLAIGAAASQGSEADKVSYNVRVMNLLWRVRHEPERGLEARLRAEAQRPVPQLASEATATNRRTQADRAARKKAQEQAEEALARLEQARKLEEDSIRKMFDKALQIPDAPDRAPPSAPRDRALEGIVAHCLATARYTLAGELGARLASPSEDMQAALGAVQPAGMRTKLAKLAPEDAVDRAVAHRFGRQWSRFVRDRIRARLHAIAGQSSESSRIYRRLNEERDTVFALFALLICIAALAGLFGLFAAASGIIKARVAQAAGAPPWQWLRDRYGGLPLLPAFIDDAMVPLLGLGGWLLGYSLAATALAALPGPRSPGGLAVLFQGLAGLLVTWAVISAFSRTRPPIAAARIFPSEDVESPWRASTAALRAFCVLLPAVMVASVINTLLVGDGDPHPVAHLMLNDTDPFGWAMLGIAVVVVAPIGEELFFRAFLHQVLRQRLGAMLATLITAAVFAAVHASPAYFLVLFTLGLAFSVVFEWVGSLWASITLHALWNGCVFLLILCLALS